MLLIKKKNGAQTPPPAGGQSGLFIDPDKRTVDQGGTVIDVDATPLRDDKPAPSSKSFGLGGFSLKKPQAKSPDVVEVADKPAKKPLFSAFASKAKPARPLNVAASPRAESVEAVDDAVPVDTLELAQSPAQARPAEQTTKAGKPEKATVERKSFFAKKAAPQPKAKKAAARQPRFAAGKAEKSVVLVTELDNGRQLYWKLEAGALVQLKEAPGETAYSFAKEDFRYRTDGALSYKQANDLALTEIGETVQIVNRSKDLKAVYAARADRVLETKFLLFPGQQALDRILTERNKFGQSLICGFHFKGEGNDEVAVLYHVAADGEASKPQISVNPDSMEFVIAQFSASRKVDKNITEVVLFDNAEFLAALQGSQPFPNEPVWRGVPVRKLLSAAALGSVVVAAGVTAFAGLQWQQQQALSSKQSRLKSELDQARHAIDSRILAAVPTFAKVMSLDPRALGQRAQQLYVEDSHMVMSATLAEVSYSLAMPIVRQQSFNNRPSVMDPITTEHHDRLIKFHVPEGCTASPLSATGALNDTHLKITCETGNTAFGSYRND